MRSADPLVAAVPGDAFLVRPLPQRLKPAKIDLKLAQRTWFGVIQTDAAKLVAQSGHLFWQSATYCRFRNFVLGNVFSELVGQSKVGFR